MNEEDYKIIYSTIKNFFSKCGYNSNKVLFKIYSSQFCYKVYNSFDRLTYEGSAFLGLSRESLYQKINIFRHFPIDHFEVSLEENNCFISYAKKINSKMFTIKISENGNIDYPKFNFYDEISKQRYAANCLMEKLQFIYSYLDRALENNQKYLNKKSDELLKKCEEENKKWEEQRAAKMEKHRYYKLVKALEPINSRVQYALKNNSLDTPSKKFYTNSVVNEFTESIENDYNQLLEKYNYHLRISATETYHRVFSYQYEPLYVISKDGKTVCSCRFYEAYPADPSEFINSLYRGSSGIYVPKSASIDEMWYYCLDGAFSSDEEWMEEFASIVGHFKNENKEKVIKLVK